MDKSLLSIKEQSTIKEAMALMTKTGRRVAPIVDESGKLIAIATDGDIRRALLAGKSLLDKAFSISDKNPITASVKMPKEEFLKIMEENNIVTLPIIDEQGILKDLVLMQDLVKITLSSPDITNEELNSIKEVLKSSTLSIGPKVEEFESLFAKYIGVKYAIAVNSGTSALHLCTRALDIKDGDEIITTPFSFIASANCALFERAKPVFVDIDEKTLCIDPDKIEEKISKKTKAILPVHVFGYPCDMDKIMAIAKKHHLAVIEDACEALGAEFLGKKVGSFGNVGVFAFYPNKQITTSEGGMIVTNDEKIAQLCRAMRNQGRTSSQKWLSHEILGYNYRLGELNSALGVIQMKRLTEILEKRNNVAEFYAESLKEIKGVEIPYIAPNVKISWFVYIIRLSSRFSKEDRDSVIEEMKKQGVPCRDYFPPIHLEPLYVTLFGYKEGNYPITESVSARTIALPFYNNLNEKQIIYICQTLESVIKKMHE